MRESWACPGSRSRCRSASRRRRRRRDGATRVRDRCWRCSARSATRPSAGCSSATRRRPEVLSKAAKELHADSMVNDVAAAGVEEKDIGYARQILPGKPGIKPGLNIVENLGARGRTGFVAADGTYLGDTLPAATPELPRIAISIGSTTFTEGRGSRPRHPAPRARARHARPAADRGPARLARVAEEGRQGTAEIRGRRRAPAVRVRRRRQARLHARQAVGGGALPHPRRHEGASRRDRAAGSPGGVHGGVRVDAPGGAEGDPRHRDGARARSSCAERRSTAGTG